MRKYWPAALMLFAAIAMSSSASAQEATQAGAAKTAAVEAAVGTAVADRQLTGMAESFPVATGTLYCFTKVMNATDTQLEHVWYKGETEMGRVTLTIGGSPWRTWSSKKLSADAAGDWRCDVVKEGTVLQSVKFKVE
jgi:hypothetical protein